MRSGEPHVLILGGGPAGVGAAYRLRRDGTARVTLLEQRDGFGGNAGSFEFHGQRVDFGSHRLHPASDAVILEDIRKLLGEDLLDRPRHGRIRLRGRWIHFPLKPLDLLLRLDPRFAAGAAKDAAGKLLPGRNGDGGDSFASVLQATLGPTICRDFYFPYARKLWGMEPDRLSPIQARRRVSANSFGRLARKIAGQLPGRKRDGKGRFFYPRRGFGQISEVFAETARRQGAELFTGSRVERLRIPAGTGDPWNVSFTADGASRSFDADFVWSTLPLPLLARLVDPAPPQDVLQAARQLRSRAMLLVYLGLDVDRFTEYDAHYFPGADVRITRLSEPKNYVGAGEPPGSTVLCAELPCGTADPEWGMSDAELAKLVARDLARAGVPLPVEPSAVHVGRLAHAYPIYEIGYEAHFATLDDWVDTLPRLLSYGRQGLFAHDNTHHALYMAYSAADALTPAGFDRERWAASRRIFESHVVED